MESEGPERVSCVQEWDMEDLTVWPADSRMLQAKTVVWSARNDQKRELRSREIVLPDGGGWKEASYMSQDGFISDFVLSSPYFTMLPSTRVVSSDLHHALDGFLPLNQPSLL